MRKLGDRWRAEILVGTQRLVVVGQPGARIPSTALVEGRSAEVVGIVRPAYPSASDKRPSILPRSSRDVRLAPGTPPRWRVQGTRAGTASSRSDGVDGSTVPDSGEAATAADLVDLERLVGSVVRVGGLVVDLRPDGFTLDDGTAIGRVVLTGPAGDWIDLVEPDDAINVTGVVTVGSDGDEAVVVDDPATITLGSTLDGPGASPDPTRPDGLRGLGRGLGIVGSPGSSRMPRACQERASAWQDCWRSAWPHSGRRSFGGARRGACWPSGSLPAWRASAVARPACSEPPSGASGGPSVA